MMHPEKQSENETQISDVDFNINMEQSHSNSTSAIAISNIIINMPRKNCNLTNTLFLILQKLGRCSNEEKRDVLVVLPHFITEDVKTAHKENSTEIINIPRKTKRTVFSSLPTFSKFRYKDELLKIMMKTKEKVTADNFSKIFQSITSSWAFERQLLKDTCGVSIKNCFVPVCKRVSVEVASQEPEITIKKCEDCCYG